jgi:hypothetical protein
MGKLDEFSEEDHRQLSIDELMAEIAAEESGRPVGDCPFIPQCREERWRHQPYFRPGWLCHWMQWRDWDQCPIYKEKKANSGKKGAHKTP